MHHVLKCDHAVINPYFFLLTRLIINTKFEAVFLRISENSLNSSQYSTIDFFSSAALTKIR